MTLYFFQSVSSSITDPANWFEDAGYSVPHGNIPVPGDDAVYQSGTNATCDSGTIDYQSTVQGSAIFTFQMGTSQLTNTFTSSGQLQIVSSGKLEVANSGSLILSNGTFEIGSNSTLDIVSGGVYNCSLSYSCFGTFQVSSGGTATHPASLSIQFHSGSTINVLGTFIVEGSIVASTTIVQLNSNGHFQINSTGIFDDSEGNSTIDVSDSSILDFRNVQGLSSPVQVSESGSIIIKSGSTVYVYDEIYFNTSDTSLIIEGTGKLSLTGLLTIDASTDFDIYSGGILELNNGSTFANAIADWEVGGTVIIYTPVTLDSGKTWTLLGSGVLRLGSGGSLLIHDVVLPNNAYIIIEGGTFNMVNAWSFDGEIVVSSGAALTIAAPWTGSSTATMTIEGTVGFSDAATLTMENPDVDAFIVNSGGLLNITGASNALVLTQSIFNIIGVVSVGASQQIPSGKQWNVNVTTGVLNVIELGTLHVYGVLTNNYIINVYAAGGVIECHVEGVVTNNAILNIDNYLYLQDSCVFQNTGGSSLNIGTTGNMIVLNSATFSTLTPITLNGGLSFSNDVSITTTLNNVGLSVESGGVLSVSGQSIFIIFDAVLNVAVGGIAQTSAGGGRIAIETVATLAVSGTFNLGTGGLLEIRNSGIFTLYGTFNHTGHFLTDGSSIFQGSGTWNRLAGNLNLTDMVAGTNVDFPSGGGTPVYSFGGGGIF